MAFQLAWKLFQSKWNRSHEPTRRPHVLFLADRNILANQAFKDFFDFIIIDECHRGGAKDESSWRGILEYFSTAVQLGLTATPLRKHNADTYAYFGGPVYTYALRDGINDGFLTPFKVDQISTTLYDYRYTSDDEVIDGEVQVGRLYEENDFNKIIEIKEREAYRVKLFLDSIDQREKTIIFCATQLHALAIRDLINHMKTSRDSNYCCRVTADDGARGETHLKHFQDIEKTIPTILTTSQKLSTGVNARQVRHIVLLRPVNSMIEFKQIIGRGTRLYEGKDYFTVHDFVGAYRHFADPEWDGEPLDPEPPKPKPPGPDSTDPPPPDQEKPDRPRMLQVTLADGKARQIQHMVATSFWGPDGIPLSSEEFLKQLFGDLPSFFSDEAQLRELWSHPETRRKLMAGLAEKGYTSEQLDEIRKLIKAENSDLFDVLAYISFSKDLVTRRNRVTEHKDLIFSHYSNKQQAFLDFVLTQYINIGITELDDKKLPTLLELKYQDLNDATLEIGEIPEIRNLFVGFQRHLFDRTVEDQA